jgi:hypothetical protein
MVDGIAWERYAQVRLKDQFLRAIVAVEVL